MHRRSFIAAACASLVPSIQAEPVDVGDVYLTLEPGRPLSDLNPAIAAAFAAKRDVVITLQAGVYSLLGG